MYSETQNAYDFRLTTAGWWGGVSLTFNSLTFGGKPVDPTEMINEGLANQNTDWSLAEHAELWSTAQGTVVTGDNYAVKKNGTYNSSDHIVSVNPLLIELAVAAGYKTMTVTTTAAGAWNTFTVHKPGTSDFSETGADNYVARAKNGAAGDPVTLTVTLADLYNESTGEYELKMTTAGWWNNVVWTFNSLTFEKPVQTVTLEELFANKTNFAEVAYAEYWATAAGLADISGSHYVAKRNGATASDVVISVNNKLLSEAAKLGYTHLTVTSTVSSGLDNTFVIYRPGVTDFTQYTNSSYYLVSAKSGSSAGGSVTHTVALADLYNSTSGEYELNMQTMGWWGGSAALTFNALTFSNKVVEMIEGGIASSATNWALTKYASIWTNVAGTVDTTGANMVYKRGSTSNGYEVQVRINADLLAAAVAQGYTHVTIGSTVMLNSSSAGTNQFIIHNPGTTDFSVRSGLAYKQTKDGSETLLTVKIADLWNASTKTYDMVVTTNGWWGGNATWTMNTLVFYNQIKSINFAESQYAEYWTATNATLNTSGETISVKCADGFMLSVSSELLAKAVEEGCTTITITTNSGNFDNWFDIYNPNYANVTGNSVAKKWKELSVKPTEREVSWTLNLADLLNDNGEYVLNIAARGWWNGCVWTVTSLTFA